MKLKSAYEIEDTPQSTRDASSAGVQAIEYFSARGPWDLTGTYNLIHELQPNAVITNNAHILPVAGEDYQISELDLPGKSTLWFNCAEVGTKPTACWWNLNAGWSYQPWNHRVAGAREERYRDPRHDIRQRCPAKRLLAHPSG